MRLELARGSSCKRSNPGDALALEVTPRPNSRNLAGTLSCPKSKSLRSVSPTRWKAKFGRMDVSEARKLKTLKTENSRLKMLLSLP
jgi:hypothetical protein